jgi:vacuolar-type H+-ATPase subunit F/Vma7
MEIVAVGDGEFSLGFELAGVRSVRLGKEQETMIGSLMRDERIGILIVGKRSFDALSQELRDRMLRAIRPISVILSEEESNDELRAMIIKSIGVDLWKDDA